MKRTHGNLAKNQGETSELQGMKNLFDTVNPPNRTVNEATNINFASLQKKNPSLEASMIFSDVKLDAATNQLLNPENVALIDSDTLAAALEVGKK